MNESNQNLLSIVNGACVASCENHNYSGDEETNSSEIKSANKVSNIFMVVQMKRMAIMILLVLSIIWHKNPIIVLEIQENGQKQASQFMDLTWLSI